MGDRYKGNMSRPQATFVIAIALAGGGALLPVHGPLRSGTPTDANGDAPPA